MPTSPFSLSRPRFPWSLVVPDHVIQAGPTDGGTLITVHGQGFRTSNATVCRFTGGTLIYSLPTYLVPATVVSPTRVTCVTPELPVEGSVHLDVGVAGEFSDSNVTYEVRRGNACRAYAWDGMLVRVLALVVVEGIATCRCAC